MTTYLYRWANDARHNQMPTVAELEADGYEWVGPHPRYESSILMRKREAPE